MSNLLNLVAKRSMSSASGIINHVTIVGAGLMGSGIAQVLKMSYNSPKVQSAPFFL